MVERQELEENSLRFSLVKSNNENTSVFAISTANAAELEKPMSKSSILQKNKIG